MIKRTLAFLVGFFLLVPFFFYIINFSFSQSITLSDKKVIYDLPYAGVLPDNPLYIVKQIRDFVVELTTRDYAKKAEFLLLGSDKRVNMAMQLAKKGKNKLAIRMLLEAENNQLKINTLMQQSKKQGSAFKESFIYRLKLSNVKHREVIETLIKEMPQGEEKDLNDVIDLNDRVRTNLEHA